MKAATKKIVAKPVEHKSVSSKIRAMAKRKVVDGVIMLDPNNPSDREFWEEDEAGESYK
ncbi:hypothetical protein SPSIL_052490 [Sporomusa silvacetica DSM 10669]|uniref:Uncharacterized protein n=1 Tax=Sporomusa silvacetica DSM 10669 TaxID=1123289 RepID=A0ABZ3ITJ3_9FIRM|nr:hypothetical protein [Sporomusa silvacetica]OZC19660.1 hypothetical protein SPSIL_20900 [Sporomusa silvacetica DSM 10669]